MTADLLGWSSTMTDTVELPRVLRGELQPTMEMHPPIPPDDAPAPIPQRLPKRLRRRALAHLADAWRAAVFTRTALAAALAATTIGALA